MSSDPPPPASNDPSAAPSMEGGGVYFRWADRLWQEQADGSYLVWDEEDRAWEPSTVQPPPQAGETRQTKECPNCGKRVKATLRHCPHCEFGFEDRVSRQPAPSEEASATSRTRTSIPNGVVLAALALVVVAAIGGFFLFQNSRACDNWRSALEEVTQAKIELQGLPEGMSEDELYESNEALLADKRPGGCE